MASNAVEYFQPSGPKQPVAAAKYLRGLALYKLGRNAEALRWMRDAIADQPHQVEYRDTLGQVLAALGQNQAALQVYLEAIQHPPVTVSILNHLAELLRICGRPEAALKVLKSAAAVGTRDPVTLTVTGDSLFELKRYDEALGCYDRALEASPGHLPAHTSRSFLLECMGFAEKAVLGYRRILELDHGSEYARHRLEILSGSATVRNAG